MIQVYTGDGKGKTTAALGLAFRAIGQGLRVYLVQFLKPAHLSSGEAKLAKRLKIRLTFKRLNTPWWSLTSFQREKDRLRMQLVLRKYLAEIEEIIRSKKYDLIILDEINNCISAGLIKKKDFLDLLKKKPLKTELVLTGRRAPKEFLALADLVTEMKMVKHPFSRGKKARRGIEY